MKYQFGDKVTTQWDDDAELPAVVLEADSARQLYHVRTRSSGSGWVAPAAVRQGWDSEHKGDAE